MALRSAVMLELCILLTWFSPILEGVKHSTQDSTLLVNVAEIQPNQNHLPCDPNHYDLAQYGPLHHLTHSLRTY